MLHLVLKRYQLEVLLLLELPELLIYLLVGVVLGRELVQDLLVLHYSRLKLLHFKFFQKTLLLQLVLLLAELGD